MTREKIWGQFLALLSLFAGDSLLASQPKALRSSGRSVVAAPAMGAAESLSSASVAQRQAGLHLRASQRLPEGIAYRFEQRQTSSTIPADLGELVPGLYDLVLSANGQESFRQVILAASELPSEIWLDYRPEIGFSLRQSFLLPAVTFVKNQFRLRRDSLPSLQGLISLMQNDPALTLLRIEVHTDADGEEISNLALTQARADHIAQYMQRHGIASQRLRSVGKGSAEPLLDRSHPNAKLKNRRTEFYIEELGEPADERLHAGEWDPSQDGRSRSGQAKHGCSASSLLLPVKAAGKPYQDSGQLLSL